MSDDDQAVTQVVPVAFAPATPVAPLPPAGLPPPPPTEVARIPTIPDSRPRGEPGFLIRAVWFIFIGWWLSALAIGVAYFLCAIIIGLPLGVHDLQPAAGDPDPAAAHDVRDGRQTRAAPALDPGRLVHLRRLVARRDLHEVAWFLCVILITLPIGLWLFNRVGAVMTSAAATDDHGTRAHR